LNMCTAYIKPSQSTITSRAFLTKVGTGFVKKKCYNIGIERGFESIKTAL
jgi:hypothetical protein